MDTSLSVWLEITEQWGADRSDCVAVYGHLLTAYSAKGRYYHDLTHIEHMFEVANDVIDQIQDHDAMFFAIWFHDAIQLEAKDSEGLSSELAVRELESLGIPQSILTSVTGLILATKHNDVEVNGDIALFLDIDLSVLSSNRKQYQKYADGCRKEYRVPSFIYRYGRKRFLQGLIGRMFIFHTKLFQRKSELSARENIEWELQRL